MTRLSTRLLAIGVLSLPFMAMVRSCDHLAQERRQGDCIMHMKQISLALRQYNSVYGSLPPVALYDNSGKPVHSWRVMILPFLGAADVYEKYDFSEPWNGPHNSQLQREMVKAQKNPFTCPSSGLKDGRTNYAAVTGSKTMWQDRDASPLDDASWGVQQVGLVIEMPSFDANWMEPKDISIDEAIAVSTGVDRHTAIHSRGIPYVDTAQRVRAIPAGTTEDNIKKLFISSVEAKQEDTSK